MHNANYTSCHNWWITMWTISAVLSDVTGNNTVPRFHLCIGFISFSTWWEKGWRGWLKIWQCNGDNDQTAIKIIQSMMMVIKMINMMKIKIVPGWKVSQLTALSSQRGRRMWVDVCADRILMLSFTNDYHDDLRWWWWWLPWWSAVMMMMMMMMMIRTVMSSYHKFQVLGYKPLFVQWRTILWIELTTDVLCFFSIQCDCKYKYTKNIN